MPYPNEHACRLREPSEFADGSFRRGDRDHGGKSYGVIYGKLKGGSSMTEQAYRYPKKDWTAEQARSHCGRHGGKFEAASEAAEESVLTTCSGTWTASTAVSATFAPKEDNMTKEELKDKHPDVYLAVFDEGKAAGATESQDIIGKLKAEKKEAEEQTRTAIAEKMAMEKELLIERSNRIAEREEALVSKTMDAMLGESSIPEALFDKVKAQVDYRKFLNGEELVEGSASFKAFSDAFSAEIRDWETRLPVGSHGLGLGGVEKSDKISNDNEPKSAFGDENLRILGKIKEV